MVGNMTLQNTQGDSLTNATATHERTSMWTCGAAFLSKLNFLSLPDHPKSQIRVTYLTVWIRQLGNPGWIWRGATCLVLAFNRLLRQHAQTPSHNVSVGCGSVWSCSFQMHWWDVILCARGVSLQAVRNRSFMVGNMTLQNTQRLDESSFGFWIPIFMFSGLSNFCAKPLYPRES